MAASRMIRDALELAIRVHGNQLDKQGKPYLMHVLRVAAAQETERAFVIGLLHDVAEDGNGVHLLGFPAGIGEGVDLLTRRKSGETYAEYIRRIRDSGAADAIAVKLADLEDNLLRCQGDPRFASLVDRYHKALSVLEE